VRYVIAIVALALLVALIANSGRVGYRWFRVLLPSAWPGLYILVSTALAVAIVGLSVACRISGVNLPSPLITADYVALAAFLFYVVLANLTVLILWLGRLIHLIPRPQPPAVTFVAAATVFALILALTSYGTVHAHTITDRSYNLTVTGPASGLDDLDIALISDTHLGYILSADFFRRVVERVNDLRPDVVLMAGDIFDGDYDALADPDAVRDLLGNISAPAGLYACLGNHDSGPGAERMVELLESAGVHVLRDEAIVVQNRFVVAGRRDSSPIGRTDDIPRQPLPAWTDEARDLPVIVLDHQPSNIGEYGDPVDLIVSGHTHDGQIFPGNLIVHALFDAAYGYYRASPTSPQVITTSGVGTWGPPLRIASNSEVVHIHLDIEH
jgi:predicted MPP superfamily phosphohydrolase